MRTIKMLAMATSPDQLAPIFKTAMSTKGTTWTPKSLAAKLKEYNPKLAKLAAAVRPRNQRPVGQPLVAPVKRVRRKPAAHPDTGKVLEQLGSIKAVLTPLAGGPTITLKVAAVARQYPRKVRVEATFGNMGKHTMSVDAWHRLSTGEGTQLPINGNWYAIQNA